MLRKLHTLFGSSPMFIAGLLSLALAFVLWIVGPAGGSGDVSRDGAGVFHGLLYPLLVLGIGLILAGWIRASLHRSRRNKRRDDH